MATDATPARAVAGSAGFADLTPYIEEWRRERITIVEGFLPEKDVRAGAEHIHELYRDEPECLTGPAERSDGESGRVSGVELSDDQFRGLRFFPYPGQPTLNVTGLDTRILFIARSVLETDDVAMHQNLVHVKHTGLANYDQPFHLDYPLHTLLVPGERPQHKTVICTLFLTDVGSDSGPFSYVPRQYTGHLDAAKTVLSEEETRELAPVEHKLIVPAGTLLVYSPDDLYHRGTNLTGAGARRWSLTASFHASDCGFAGGNRWASDGLNRNWPVVFGHATPEQLAVIGVPRPGHPYWTAETIRLVQSRYPSWDLAPWRAALDRNLLG